jgi:transcriptional regulator with XRE-family HTH domain
MYIGGNLKFLRKLTAKSQEDMANVFGLTRSTYSGYENSVAEPSIEKLLEICNYYKLTSDLFLKTDFSSMSEEEWNKFVNNQNLDIEGRKIRILTQTVDADDNELIELIPQKARAGYVSGYADPEYLKVLPTFTLPFLSKEKKYRSFPIEGDSMPPVTEGSYVVAEFIQNWRLIKSGTPCIVVTKEDGIVFKIVNNYLDVKQSFQLVSTNPFYEPYFIHVNEIIEMWKFVNYISPELPNVKLDEDSVQSSIRSIKEDISEMKELLRKG